MNKNMKKYYLMMGTVLLLLFPAIVQAYDLPPPGQRKKAYAEELSVHNAQFLRDKTLSSVIAYLRQDGNKYELTDHSDPSSRVMGLPLEVHPEIKIDPALVGKKVKATGLMTYKTMYFPNMPVENGPAFSFKFQLYAIEAQE